MDNARWRMVALVLRATAHLQWPLVLVSLLTLPAAWLLLGIPKHIINHVLATSAEHGGMTFFGFELSRLWLLLSLCAGYLAALTINGLAKLAATRISGRINERVVRRLRLQIARRARKAALPHLRASLAAVAIQEIEPIGNFSSNIAVVPIVHGGTLLLSILFLFFENVALAAAALVMLPAQIYALPRMQSRLNAKVRERVYATRALSGLMTMLPYTPLPDRGEGSEHAPLLQRQMRQVGILEKLRVEIHDLKGNLKGFYNYTSNLTPFFFFVAGGYLVVENQLSLGALVAALAAYREVSPALRELFDFAQNWSDATARFEEVSKVLENALDNPRGSVGRGSTCWQEPSAIGRA